MFEGFGQAGFHNALITFITSMLPVAELRVGLPLGISLGLSWYWSFIISVAGNMVPVPLIIVFSRKVILWLKKGPLRGLMEKVERHVGKKARVVLKYSFIGLFVLVAIPLPGTGAWTGSFVAALLDMRLKKAVPIIFAGVLTAGGIMLLLTQIFHLVI